eukprot:8448548-Pyramimonas_sp.AAC.1
MYDFTQRTLALFPEAGVTVASRDGRRHRKGGGRPNFRHATLSEMNRILELLFADDANVIVQADQRAALERFPEETLRAWGQEVAPEKYERLRTGEVEPLEADLYSKAV